MSLVSCNAENQLFQQGIMTVKVAYNMADPVAKAANERQIAAYSNISGLPDLSTPLMVENVINLKNSQLIDNGKGVIVPPDTYLAFQIGFGCQVGFGFGIEILPSSIAIVDNNSLILPRSSVAATNQWTVAGQYAFRANGGYDGDMIYVYDDNFGTHPLGQEIATNSYQIRLTCTPLLSWTDGDGNTYSVDRPNLDPPSNPPNLPGLVAAQGDGDINVHGGTVTGSGTSGQHYGGCRGYTMDSQSVSLVLDVFVVNQKYYNTQTYQLFQSGGGDGLND
ncbi:hypothetical protein [Corallococcus sicarius]|uniref:Uncharacterized protein n=1 Tax=Corallococcus sicarius TaxID=2316726 RepID=A0A3A8P4P8_9BACT|nr:hypothetical protein [Corallococcus sicarius]RKH47422.1 hypothetical protein D7X12_02870 [Corallococcus sicarius]